MLYTSDLKTSEDIYVDISMLNTSRENVWTLLGIKGGMQQNVSRNEEEENSAKAEDCHEVCLDLTREEVVTLEEEEESDFSDECEMDFDVSKDLWVKKQRNSSWVEVHIYKIQSKTFLTTLYFLALCASIQTADNLFRELLPFGVQFSS